MSKEKTSIGFGVGLIAGVVGGIIAGVLLAPKSGEESREKIKYSGSKEKRFRINRPVKI